MGDEKYMIKSLESFYPYDFYSPYKASIGSLAYKETSGNKNKSLAAEIVKRRGSYYSYSCKYKSGYSGEYVFLSTEKLDVGSICMTSDYKVVEVISEKDIDVDSGFDYKFLQGVVYYCDNADDAQQSISEVVKEIADSEVKRKNDQAIEKSGIKV